MSSWKNRLVLVLLAVLGGSSAVFGGTGYFALYHAWGRGDLASALPYLPWARSFGLLAVAGAAAALGILFSVGRVPMAPRLRLALSLLATGTIALFAEFRNEGKFHFGNLHHFLLPGEWMHDGLTRVAPPLGDFLYRVEYSHWNDFLIGPAIVSVIYAVVFWSIYSAHERQGGALTLGLRTAEEPTDLDNKLRAARIVMYVGLLWFFMQAWGEKAGYLANPHSRDPVDLPVEFAGTVVGFWMARVLTRPFDRRPETFRSTFLNDFVASGILGLIYTLIVGPLTQGVSRAVARGLYPVVPDSLEVSEYTPLEQHLRPLELLLLAAATWWICNRLLGRGQAAGLDDDREEPGTRPRWHVLITVAKAVGVTATYLFALAAILSVLEPEGRVVTLTLLGLGTGAGTVLVLVVRRMGQGRLTTLFGAHEHPDAGELPESSRQASPCPPRE